MSPRALRLIGRPFLDAVARRSLAGRLVGRPKSRRRLSRAETKRIIGRLWAHFDALAPRLPWEPTFGARMNVGLAAVTVAGHRALTESGIDPQEASEVLAEMAWRVYRTWGLVPAVIARLFTPDPLRRLRICTDLFRRFPFNPPGYRMEDVPAEGAVVFAVRRCPVADYFRSQGLSTLCVQTWCALDEPLARMWGGALERKGTLAGGAAQCDFRWVATKETTP
jgi:ubiquinone biosynthesis protein